MTHAINRPIDRRTFLASSSAFAFAPFAGAFAAPDARPLFRMGVMTDTHVGTTLASCGRVKQALEVFKREGVDLVVNNGDIADHFYPEGYKALRETYSTVYPDPQARPREVWVYAWHDAYEFRKDIPRDDTWKQADFAFPVVRALLGASDPVTASFEFRGIPMLVFHQFDRRETYERMLAEAARKHPGKPIFVFSHVPPRGTVYNSWNWGDTNQRRVYEKYPQVIAFSGHVHGSLRNDLFIWQKDFTVINAGCLQVWSGIAANAHAANKQSYGVLTVDVYPDRLLVRRFDVRDGAEIDPRHPWQVALPFAAATAPYTIARKAARAPVPAYPADARLAVTPGSGGGFTLAFPEVAGAPRAFMHHAELARCDASGAWRRFAVRETIADYYLPQPLAAQKISFEGGYAEPGETVRVTVTPLNAYGAGGKPLVADYTVPAEKANWLTVLDVAEPGAEIKLPDGLFAGPRGTRFRLVCDLDLQQPAEGSLWELSLVDAATQKAYTPNAITVGGAPGTLRYVFAFTRPADCSGTCRVNFRRGEKGSAVRVARVRLAVAAAAPRVTRVGAVNWDCSVPSSTFFGHYATQSLSPAKYRDRTPYYAQVLGPDKIDYRDRTLAEYETEMRYALDAGIDYFAYCWYDETPPAGSLDAGLAAKADGHLQEITRARHLHAQSALRTKLGFCAILVTVHPYSDAELGRLAAAMADPGYEKVAGRPLVYLFADRDVPDVLARLRAACRRAGAGDPYAVLMTGGANVKDATKPHIQALSAYACGAPRATYAELSAASLAQNTLRAAQGFPVVPHLTTGWDPSPRIDHPTPWTKYPAGRPYVSARTREDFLRGADELKKWIAAHPAACTTGHVLAFAWNEFEEGGWICPTAHPAGGAPDTSRARFFAEAVRALKRP